MGVNFRVLTTHVEETFEPGTKPADIVESLAEQKARPVADIEKDHLVLAADTIVVLDGKILGKPETPATAEAMLRSLSGRSHDVYTGIALIHAQTNRSVTAHERTEVTISTLSDDEIRTYVRGGSPMDKAGAYGIQDDRGALFVSSIRGDYYTVMGLPLSLLYRLVKANFPDLTIF